MMNDPNEKHPIRNAAISAGLTGGTMAGLGTLFSKFSPTELAEMSLKKRVLSAILKGAGSYAALGAGATATGVGLLGEPGEDEPTGYTRRGGIGGAVGGGIAGGALGAAIGSGKMKMPSMAPEWLARYASKLSGARGAKIGGALGALGLGAAAAYAGSDEGMPLDYLNNELHEQEKEKKRREYEQLLSGSGIDQYNF